MQVLYRAGLIRSTGFLGLQYYQGLTLHGVINALVFTTFFEVAFGYVVVAYFLRQTLRRGGDLARRRAHARRHVDGGVRHAHAARASVLYTFYPPLKASPLFYIGATLLVVGSWIPVLPVDPRVSRLAAGAPAAQDAARRGRHAGDVHRVVPGDAAAGVRGDRPAHPVVTGVDADGQRRPGAHAVLVLRTSAGLLLAAAGVRDVLRDAAGDRRRQALLRRRRRALRSCCSSCSRRRWGCTTSSPIPASTAATSGCTAG